MLTTELEKVTISAETTVRTALQRLCENGQQILFVTENGVLRASLTDGDVRRFLLKDGTLDASVSEAANFKPHYVFTTERRNAESVLAESKFNALPIVDEEMRLVDVVTMHDTVNLGNVKIRELLPADLPMVMEFFDQMAGDTRAMFNRNGVNRLRAIEHLKCTQPDKEIHFAAVVPSEDGELMVGYVFSGTLTRSSLGSALPSAKTGRDITVAASFSIISMPGRSRRATAVSC